MFMDIKYLKGEQEFRYKHMKIKGNAIKNNFYALGLVWGVCKEKLLMHFFINFMQVILDFVNGIFFLRTIIIIIEKGNSYEQYIFFVTFILILNTIRALLNAHYYYYSMDILNNKMISELNKKIFSKAEEVDISCYENKDFYEDYYWAIQNVEKNINSIINNMTSLISYLFLCIIIVVYVISIDPFVLIFLFGNLIVHILLKKIKEININKQIETSIYNREKEYVKKIIFQKDYAKEMRMSNMYTVIKENYENAITNIIRVYKKYGLKLSVLQFITQFFSSYFAFFGACLYLIYRIIFKKDLLVADFAVLISSITLFSQRINNVITSFNIAHEHSFYIIKLKSYFNYRNVVVSGESNTQEFLDLEIKNVNFSYSKDSEKVLSNLNFKIQKGEKIAIVGPNGAGKTSLIKLLLRFYDVNDGSIIYNKQDIKNYNLKDYRSRYGVVFQSNHIFALNITENVLMDNFKISKESVIKSALLKSGMQKLINEKQGIFTNLTKIFDEDGTILSEGQNQKLYVARLYAGNFDIAILDEPSSSLDPIAEQVMYEKLMDLTKYKTVIYISHKLSSVILADKIIVLNNGIIEGIGTHSELMKTNKLYASMFYAQAQNYLPKGNTYENQENNSK